MHSNHASAAINHDDAINDVNRLVALCRWIEDARFTIDNIALSRKLDSELAESLSAHQIFDPIEWGEEHSNGLGLVLENIRDSVALLRVKRDEVTQ